MVSRAQGKEAEKAIVKALKMGDQALAHAHALDASAEPERPVRGRYKTQDTTVEKLGELLRDNPRGILIYRDELVGFLKSLDQEGREGSRAFYLEAWNGSGGYTFDRIGRGTIEIEAACVSIIGGIQPGPLGDYMIAAIRGGMGDDGLVQRFQLAVWPDAPREWRNIDRWPDTQARRTAREVYERLDFLTPDILAATRDGESVPFFRFAADAQTEFDAWRADLERRIRADDLHPSLEAHLAKFRSLIPSLALLFHLADHPEGGPVDLESATRAMAWGEYLETHARRIYAPAIAPDMAAAVELDRRLSSLPNPFTARDVYRNCWRMLDREGTVSALGILADYGRVRAVEPDGTGRPTIRYQVNPAIRKGPA
jgi:putative DNA primase/helicase